MVDHKIPIFSQVLLRRGNSILLLKRADDALYAPGKYCIVGGRVEQLETFRQAIVREAFEEVGVRIHQDDLHFVHVFQKQTDGVELLVCVFACDVWQGEPYNKEPHKHSEMIWVDQNKLPQSMVAAHRSAIEHNNQKEAYSEQF